MKKKIAFAFLVLAPIILASCGKSSTSSANKDHFDDTYAGYEADLNGDGTISSDEKGLTWANSYDKIIKNIKATTGDEPKRFKLMHAAETELMSTGAICPIYYYTDLFLKKENITGFYSMPLGYKFFYGAQAGTSGAITACLASKPKTIDPALNTTLDGGTYDEHLFEGLYRWNYTGAYPNGAATIVPGLATSEAEVDNTDGTITYTYTLRDGLKWSDGTTLTASDIVRSWKRAVSTDLASSYNYLFEAIKGGTTAETETDGASLAVSASDATHLTVTLNNAITYWHELLAFPTFAPVPTSADAAGNWAASTNAASFVSNGPMKIKAFDDTKLEMVPNANYYNTSLVKATDLTFAFSDDDSATLTSYQSGAYQFIQSFPVAEISTLKTTLPKEFFDMGELGTYYLSWNINTTAFDDVLDSEPKRVAFRNALSLLINRQYITDDVAKGGQIPANGFVSKGLTGPNGVGDWTDSNGPLQDGSGWYKTDTADYAANKAEAITLLKDTCGFAYDGTKFTNIPTFEYIYNTSDNHKAIAEAVQAMLASVGVAMTLANSDWATFVSTRQAGNYVLSRNGWLCDYNDPISMLDMWISTSGNNDCRFGKSTAHD
jgi:oligopeptide transport system substrate-binding protein